MQKEFAKKNNSARLDFCNPRLLSSWGKQVRGATGGICAGKKQCREKLPSLGDSPPIPWRAPQPCGNGDLAAQPVQTQNRPSLPTNRTNKRCVDWIEARARGWRGGRWRAACCRESPPAFAARAQNAPIKNEARQCRPSPRHSFFKGRETGRAPLNTQKRNSRTRGSTVL